MNKLKELLNGLPHSISRDGLTFNLELKKVHLGWRAEYVYHRLESHGTKKSIINLVVVKSNDFMGLLIDLTTWIQKKTIAKERHGGGI